MHKYSISLEILILTFSLIRSVLLWDVHQNSTSWIVLHIYIRHPRRTNRVCDWLESGLRSRGGRVYSSQSLEPVFWSSIQWNSSQVKKNAIFFFMNVVCIRCYMSCDMLPGHIHLILALYQRVRYHGSRTLLCVMSNFIRMTSRVQYTERLWE